MPNVPLQQLSERFALAGASQGTLVSLLRTQLLPEAPSPLSSTTPCHLDPHFAAPNLLAWARLHVAVLNIGGGDRAYRTTGLWLSLSVQQTSSLWLTYCGSTIRCVATCAAR